MLNQTRMTNERNNTFLCKMKFIVSTSRIIFSNPICIQILFRQRLGSFHDYCQPKTETTLKKSFYFVWCYTHIKSHFINQKHLDDNYHDQNNRQEKKNI